MAVTEYWRSASAAPPDVMSCWLCGIRLPAAQLMPDGGPACGDVRWYCRDLRGCTERWTAPRAIRVDWQDSGQAPASGPAPGSQDSGLGTPGVVQPALRAPAGSSLSPPDPQATPLCRDGLLAVPPW
jgi:hypothetical protein